MSETQPSLTISNSKFRNCVPSSICSASPTQQLPNKQRHNQQEWWRRQVRRCRQQHVEHSQRPRQQQQCGPLRRLPPRQGRHEMRRRGRHARPTPASDGARARGAQRAVAACRGGRRYGSGSTWTASSARRHNPLSVLASWRCDNDGDRAAPWMGCGGVTISKREQNELGSGFDSHLLFSNIFAYSYF